MPEAGRGDFLGGVVEGFYGPPWTPEERGRLFDGMLSWGLNTYFYAPKDDLHHRVRWREVYGAGDARRMGALIADCRRRGLRFVYGIGPGLDVRYSDGGDHEALKARFRQLADLGCADFALLFDDIPDRMSPEDAARWGSFASAQCHLANGLHGAVRTWAPGGRFLFCPTPYCGRMASRRLGGEGYLPTVGLELAPEIDILWTGPEIISPEITPSHVQGLAAMLRRKPVLWDNLFANDYDGRRFFCGPYSGRPPALLGEVRGILCNPNTEFPLNEVPLRTFGDFLRAGPGAEWRPRERFLEGLRAWQGRFASRSNTIAFEDLQLLADSYYLPFEPGPGAAELLRLAERLLTTDPAAWGALGMGFISIATRLRDTCARVSEIEDRPLFHAMSRRVWELKEELDLLIRYVQVRSTPGNERIPVGSDFHLPETYRGGCVARLQRLLTLSEDGTFWPTVEASPEGGVRRGHSDSWMIRAARAGDEKGAYYVCLKTGDHGRDGEPFYREDPDALGRIFVGPYLAYEPGLSLILEDGQGICGYALGATDSKAFYARYEAEWRPALCAQFPEPTGSPSRWSRSQGIHYLYHHPDYFCPEPYAEYPSHLHIDLLPRAQGRGLGRRMMIQVMERLRERGSPGAHLGVSLLNEAAMGFYRKLGFRELSRVGTGADGCVYFGIRLRT